MFSVNAPRYFPTSVTNYSGESNAETRISMGDFVAHLASSMMLLRRTHRGCYSGGDRAAHGGRSGSPIHSQLENH